MEKVVSFPIVLQVRISKRQAEDIKRAAGADGVKVSDWVRHRLDPYAVVDRPSTEGRVKKEISDPWIENAAKAVGPVTGIEPTVRQDEKDEPWLDKEANWGA